MEFPLFHLAGWPSVSAGGYFHLGMREDVQEENTQNRNGWYP